MSIFTAALSRPTSSFGVAVGLTALALAQLHRRGDTGERLERQAPAAAPAAPATAPPPPTLFEGVRWLTPGQTGVTYRELFGEHLAGANVIQIVDPWLRSFRQIRLFGEFLESVVPAPGERREVKLTTSLANDTERWALGQAKALLELKHRFAERGIELKVSFDDSIHDRWIQAGEWTVLLGKGLDIWEAPGCYASPQEGRVVAKQVAVTYLRSSIQAASSAPVQSEVAR